MRSMRKLDVNDNAVQKEDDDLGVTAVDYDDDETDNDTIKIENLPQNWKKFHEVSMFLMQCSQF